jgi:N-acetyl-anhydromuramoyl-L-alanine amidase
MSEISAIDGWSGWLDGATRIDSSNFDARPRNTAGAVVDLIVVHHISLPPNEFSGDAVIDFFLNRLDDTDDPPLKELKGIRVSAHFFIRRDGRVIQFVNTHDRAWHAGVSQWRGRSSCNDFSIGIEIEGSSDVPFEEPQYRALDDIIAAIGKHHPIQGVTSHSEIAAGRKVDPGPMFDWSRLAARAAI